MADDWFGHRDPLTGKKRGNPDEWIDWDHILVSAFSTIEAHTDSHGLFRWEIEDEAVYVDAVERIDKFEQSKDQITGSKGYKPSPGAYFTPEVKTRRSNGHIQTFGEYMQAEIAKLSPEVPEG